MKEKSLEYVISAIAGAFFQLLWNFGSAFGVADSM